MKRIARLLGLLTASVAALIWSTATALASVPPPDPPGQASTTPVTTIVTHSTSGLAVWLVVLIAVASVAVGMALTETFRSIQRRHHGHGFATT